MGIAVITGAGSGIGRATALALSQSGKDVFLVGRTPVKLNQVYTELPGMGFLHACDLTDPQQTQELAAHIADICQTSGPLEILVNNAGTFARQTLLESQDEHWRAQWEENFLTHVRLTRHLLPLLQEGGTIVNIASTLGLAPVASTGAYSAAKAALINWTKTLALELAPKIRVNCVCPGLVETPIHGLEQLSADERASRLAQMNTAQPLQRVGRPEEIAAGIVYFCNPLAAWATGSILSIDGGIGLV